MLKERLVEFLQDAGYVLKKIITSRIVPFVLVGGALFFLLIYRLFDLQIVRGDSFTNTYTMKAEKTVKTTGTRGNIYDCEGRLLAYSELAYSVVIEDCGYYETYKERHSTMNAIIARMIEIIEGNGDSIDYDFGMYYDAETGNYEYSVTGNTLLRFLRDIYGHASINDLTDEERNASAKNSEKYLRNLYKIMTPSDLAELKVAENLKAAENPDFKKTDYSALTIYDDEMAAKIAYVRYNLSTNSYKRYISFTVASNVSKETMASILENSDYLIGVSIAEGTVRKYNYGVYLAHILGYTGKVSPEQLVELQKEDSSYEANDIVGKAGIEEEFELVLSGVKGEKSMLVDSVGRVLEVTNEVKAITGQDVYLTIDAELQKNIYELLERRLSEIILEYFTPNEIETFSDGSQAITVKEVCFAMINNNMISMSEIATSETNAATRCYSLFLERKQALLDLIREDLNAGKAYKSLSADMKSYVTLMRKGLIDKAFINSEKIDSSSDLQTQWSNGELSFRQYLSGAIENGWVNVYNLDLDMAYPTSEDVLNALIEAAYELIDGSSDFDKLIYEYLINNNKIAPKFLCLVAMEQGCFEYTESEYLNISNNGSVYSFLYSKIKSLAITPAQLALDPCSGSCVMEDPNTGRILAMVSYPSYDINYFSGTIDSAYYKMILNDKSTPLVNRATQTKIAPGSTFKLCSAIAGLTEGVINSSTTVTCDGIFDKITPNIKCHVYPSYHSVVELNRAIVLSCNDFFCDVGYRLCLTSGGGLDYEKGINTLKKYSDMLGLSTKTGIQIPETTPHASDYNAVVSAIGQGTHAYTSLNLARYISTIANKGTVYNSSIVSHVSDSDGSNVVFFEPEIANTVDTVKDKDWVSVQTAMNNVIKYNPYLVQLMRDLPAKFFSKSGTAQEDRNRANHALYVMFSQDKEGNPDVVCTITIPYGYAANHACIMSYYAMSCYYGYGVPASIIETFEGTLKIEY